MSSESIPFHIEINRVIELLATQIYQSPLALLRENCQNAFDAILMRRARDSEFTPKIEILVDPTSRLISVSDNGVGMSRNVLKENFWKAGSSGKNNQEARDAGVVGTFGIGAMANFGIAESLTVKTKSLESNESIISIARRNNLSATENCISIEALADDIDYGTTIVANIQVQFAINVQQAKQYIENVIKFADVDITFNGELISGKDLSSAEAAPKDPVETFVKENEKIGPAFVVNLTMNQMKNGELWLALSNIEYNGIAVKGEIVLRQNKRQILTFRSRFALAPVSISSLFGFGGIANLSILEPTAGREALTTNSIQIIQSLVTELENYICQVISESEYSILNTAYLNWILRTKRYDLAGKLKLNTKPKTDISLEAIKGGGQAQPYNLYQGSDNSIIDEYSSEDHPLILLSSTNPRKTIELNYLKKFCNINEINNNPKILSSKSDTELSLYESSFAFRIISILSSDYFVKANVKYGRISHNLPILIKTDSDPIEIYLNGSNPTIDTFLKMYESDFIVMTGVAKDFIRTTIFPKISSLVPSSTRKGAEAFLRAVKGPKDIFEYEKSDEWSLNEIWQEYSENKITLEEAASKSTNIVRETVQVIDKQASAKVSDVIPDVVTNQTVLDIGADINQTDNQLLALPAISRMNIEVDYKILTMEPSEGPLNGYRCFLAISERVRSERGDFFLQPHKTEIIWGGQKVLFIFQHHSGEFGLYYELKSNGLISANSGGGEHITSTIALKNRIFIPIPEDISANFIPNGEEKKSFEVRCELLYPDAE